MIHSFKNISTCLSVSVTSMEQELLVSVVQERECILRLPSLLTCHRISAYTEKQTANPAFSPGESGKCVTKQTRGEMWQKEKRKKSHVLFFHPETLVAGEGVYGLDNGFSKALSRRRQV